MQKIFDKCQELDESKDYIAINLLKEKVLDKWDVYQIHSYISHFSNLQEEKKLLEVVLDDREKRFKCIAKSCTSKCYSWEINKKMYR